MKRKPLFQRQNLLLQLSSKRKQLFQNENNVNNEKPRKTVADVMRQFNGLLDFETGEEALEDFRKHKGEEIYKIGSL